MSQVMLGRMVLRHCDRCNVPVLSRRRCSACGFGTREVSVTPPGDVRPANRGELQRLARLVEGSFGAGCFASMLEGSYMPLLNPAPSEERLDEVVADGRVLGAMSYERSGGNWRWTFLPRVSGLEKFMGVVTRSIVVADGGALGPVAKGGSLLSPGVVCASPGIAPGDEVVVVDAEGRLVGTGRARMSSADMGPGSRGMAVKLRAKTGILPPDVPGGRMNAGSGSDVPRLSFRPCDEGALAERAAGRPASPGPEAEHVIARVLSPYAWRKTLEANREEMERRTQKARAFVVKVAREHPELPRVVSFSGGKDSQACLHLVLDAGIEPVMLFIDTGLEVPETLEHVRETAALTGTRLVVAGAGDAFWRNLEYFGQPGRDFRWCCKTCKLGPAARAVAGMFPGGMLAFIGQRTYESFQRSRKGAVWKNPWVKGQLGASPIQDWTALHVWLYLRSKGVRHNPLYDRGLPRIGCFLCPAGSLPEFRAMERGLERGEEWVPERLGEFLDYLGKRERSSGMPEGWARSGLWRWRELPASKKALLEELGGRKEAHVAGEEADGGLLRFRRCEGYGSCSGAVSAEGAFDRSVPLEQVARWLSVLDAVERGDDGVFVRTGDGKATVFAEGAIAVRGRDEADVDSRLETVTDLVRRAVECAGCGSCVPRCPGGAIVMSGEPPRAAPEPSRCDHCGACLGPCPVTDFRPTDEYEF